MCSAIACLRTVACVPTEQIPAAACAHRRCISHLMGLEKQQGIQPDPFVPLPSWSEPPASSAGSFFVELAGWRVVAALADEAGPSRLPALSAPLLASCCSRATMSCCSQPLVSRGRHAFFPVLEYISCVGKRWLVASSWLPILINYDCSPDS